MFPYLLLLFISVPFVELFLLLWLAERIGFLTTIAITIGTGILGASLARYQGLQTWRRFQGSLAQGQLPHQELVEGVCILVAGAVLLTPGVLTDALGLLLLLPPLRGWLARLLTERLKKKIIVVGPQRGAPTIDADFTIKDP
ncbi:MAG: FxsA family protein [Planctomycetota bacterium]